MLRIVNIIEVIDLKKKRKGFTLVEVLVTIVIIGFLFTLGYFSISAILNRTDDNYYSSQENMLVLAGREYFADYRSELPKKISETSSVTLETLINEGYIEEVKDRNGKDCDYKKSTVTAQKITNSEYQYYVTLICNEDNYKTSKDSAEPVITFSPNSKSSKEKITVKLEVKDNVGVASYRYVIEKDGDVYINTEYEVYTEAENIELTEKGLYTIRAYAIDTSGNIGTAKSGKYSIYKGIDCAGVEFTSSTKAETWTNKDISIGIKVPDNTYKFEVSKRKVGEEYKLIDSYMGQAGPSYTLTDEGETEIKVTVYDKDGNSCMAVSDAYYIDKTSPSCSIGISGTAGDNGWYKEKNASITLNKSDKLGEITEYGLTTSSTVTYNQKTSGSQGNTKGTTWYGYVKDAAGNTSKCSKTIKVDVTKPSCAVMKSGVSGTDGWYKKEAGKLSLTHLDALSDISEYGLTTSSNVTYNKILNASQGDTKGTTWYGYVKDKAGNTNKCSNTIKVDTKSPTINSVTMRQDTNGKVIDPDYKDKYFLGRTFTNSNFNYYLLTKGGSARKYYATVSSNDATSSVKTIELCDSNGKNCVNPSTGILTTTLTASKNSKQIKVTDYAGNISTFPFTLSFYTNCQEWFLLNYANSLGRYPEQEGVNDHVKQYFSYLAGKTSSINDFLINSGVTKGSKQYAIISIYWNLFSVTPEARIHCGNSATQTTNECLVRHWYYTLLRRAPESSAVVTQRVKDIGSTEWTGYFNDRGVTQGEVTNVSKYPKMLNNFIAVALAENVINNLNTSSWNSTSCYFLAADVF